MEFDTANAKLSQGEKEVAVSETALNLQTDAKIQDNDIPVEPGKRKLNLALRVRRFLIKRQAKRPMEFRFHQKGVHWVSQAILRSENGCINCKLDLEKEE